jgi:membrane protein
MAVGAGFNRNDGAAMAGYIAYAGFLSIFPFAIFATAVAGQILGRGDSAAMVGALFDLAPDHVARTLEPVIEGVISGARQDLLTVSGVGALWVASNAVEAFRTAFDRAYRCRRLRPFLWRRLRAMAFVAGAALTLALLALLIIVAPLALRLAEARIGFSASWALDVVRYGLGLLVAAVFLFQMNLALPSNRPPVRRLAPGVALSTLLLLLGASGFSLYMAYAPDYTLTYGALAGVIVTLLFFYVGGVAIILGAELNACLLRLRPPRTQDFDETARRDPAGMEEFASEDDATGEPTEHRAHRAAGG